MTIGERHDLNGYRFTETLHGPFGPVPCVDCGVTVMAVVPTGRIGTGGQVEDTGAGVDPRCSACGRTFHGAGKATYVPAVPRSMDAAARRAWQDRQYPAMVPVPASAHTSRDPWPNGLVVSRGPGSLAAHAEKLGWNARITYAVGPWLGTRDTALRRSIGVRCWSGDRFALVFYVSPLTASAWKVASILVAGGPVGVFPRCNITDVRDYLAHRGVVPPDWFAGITARVTDAAVRAKASAANRGRAYRPVVSLPSL
jgi:hypothetical protein